METLDFRRFDYGETSISFENSYFEFKNDFDEVLNLGDIICHQERDLLVREVKGTMADSTLSFVYKASLKDYIRVKAYDPPYGIEMDDFIRLVSLDNVYCTGFIRKSFQNIVIDNDLSALYGGNSNTLKEDESAVEEPIVEEAEEVEEVEETEKKSNGFMNFLSKCAEAVIAIVKVVQAAIPIIASTFMYQQPVRPGRKYPRKVRPRATVIFLYRVA